ncbi:hypothetical protein NHG32_08235 [Aerococcaceae bacterium NML191219]|nr:hypothetical protein [Aerococcaceae bacterium NML191219]
MTTQEAFVKLVSTNYKSLSDDSIKTLTAVLQLCLNKDSRDLALNETRQAIADVQTGNTYSFDSIAEMKEAILNED